MRLWRIVIVTDTGREVPHWSDETRRSARESLVNDLLVVFLGYAFVLAPVGVPLAIVEAWEWAASRRAGRSRLPAARVVK
jgi:hypothetical protein